MKSIAPLSISIMKTIKKILFSLEKNNRLGRFKPQAYEREIICDKTTANFTYSNNAIIIKHVCVESQSIL